MRVKATVAELVSVLLGQDGKKEVWLDKECREWPWCDGELVIRLSCTKAVRYKAGPVETGRFSAGEAADKGEA